MGVRFSLGVREVLCGVRGVSEGVPGFDSWVSTSSSEAEYPSASEVLSLESLVGLAGEVVAFCNDVLVAVLQSDSPLLPLRSGERGGGLLRVVLLGVEVAGGVLGVEGELF